MHIHYAPVRSAAVGRLKSGLEEFHSFGGARDSPLRSPSFQQRGRATRGADLRRLAPRAPPRALSLSVSGAELFQKIAKLIAMSSKLVFTGAKAPLREPVSDRT